MNEFVPIGAAAAQVVGQLAGGIERHLIISNEQWLTLRMQDVTASDVGAVCGVNPHKPALRVYAEKTGMIGAQGDSMLMRRGRWLESGVIAALADERPSWEIRRAKVYLRDPSVRLGATPDAVAIDPERGGFGVVQCKVVAKPTFRDAWADDTPPLYYQLQTLAEAKLAGASWAVLAALVVDAYYADLRIFEVDLHEGAYTRIRDVVRGFWKAVETGEPPMPSHVTADEVDLLDALYPKPTPGKQLDLSHDNYTTALVGERDELKAVISADEKSARQGRERLKDIEAELRAKLADNESALLADGRFLTLKDRHSKGYTVAPRSDRVVDILDLSKPSKSRRKAA